MADATIRRIRVGWSNVGYLDSGSGQPLVLLHGGEGNRLQFTALRSGLGSDLRVISYDQRDCGVTAGPADRYTWSDLADDAIEVLDALGLSAVHLLGTSYGGVLAQHVAIRHPRRLLSLILVATAPANAAAPPRGLQMMDTLSGKGDALDLDLLVSPSGRAADPALSERVLVTVEHGNPEAKARRRALVRHMDTGVPIQQITTPTLVIHGSHDLLTPLEGAEKITAQIPGARLQVIADGRHGIATEFPGIVAQMVRDFLGVNTIGESP